ncbi:MAG: tyrosine decarboxylase [Microbacteriaceae bacterium]|jgi:tyrosine decarboxylase|nr:tyrosine decarboxylase [Actinomycetota bacterium]HOA85998.1 tyrosine decarboxylase [Microbacteriaceae bacterium]HPZ33827.1 tyrosine decarboxylase [Microbacteriaceae bacterium]HQE46073.1 tyrosine decarboxylase [Rhodoglobus sp.]
MSADIDVRALFLGDKAENEETFRSLLGTLIDDHIGWRKNYIAADVPAISQEDRRAPAFVATSDRVQSVMTELSQRMRSGSIPWNSAGRYWGQMNSETLMPSILAYTFAMLWNPNNVALESSMATSAMEAEIGADFAALFDFKDGWGHLSADGSIANLEGLWYARCIKSIPLAVKDVFPDKVGGKSDWELLNMSVEDILALVRDFTPDEYDAVKAASSRSGRNIPQLGKWIVPQTKHYSWVKALDISGVGLDQMVAIPVDVHYRMDVDVLKTEIEKLVAQKTPILGVVTVVGTTEEGAVDHVDKIVELREEFARKGTYFYIHCDAAYGGYGRALFRDVDGTYIPYEKLAEVHAQHNVFTSDAAVSRDVWAGYKAIENVESVTIDPHKMGYVPYAAGGIAIKHKEMRNVISYFAPYVFEKGIQAPDMLGAYILEGSKAGATAAAVWVAHRILPLDVSGYGRLVAKSIDAAHRFREFLSKFSFTVGDKTVKAVPLSRPDFNMVDWVLVPEGIGSLAELNALTEKLFDYSSYLDGPAYNNRFITSHTAFSTADYGDSPLPFVEKLGFTKDEWEKTGSVTLLRAAIMTPYLTDDALFAFYSEQIGSALQRRTAEALGD